MENEAYAAGQALGRMVGAFLILLLITRLLLLAFKERKHTVLAVSISLIIGTGIAVLVTGSGGILGGSPPPGGNAYADVAATYVIPAGLVLAIDLIRLWLKRSGERDGT